MQHTNTAMQRCMPERKAKPKYQETVFQACLQVEVGQGALSFKRTEAVSRHRSRSQSDVAAGAMEQDAFEAST